MFNTNVSPSEDLEASALAAYLKTAMNSSLTVDELKSLGVQRLKELKAKDSPSVEQQPYSINATIDSIAKDALDAGSLLRLASEVRSLVLGASTDALVDLGGPLLDDLKKKLTA